MTARSAALASRSRFIGGSDVAKILGMSPYGTPMTLWLEKLGRAPVERPDPVRDQIRARGHMLEPYVVDMTVHKLREQGHDVKLLRRNRRYRDGTHRFLACEIDFELELDGVIVNADSKTATGFTRHGWGDEETDQVPLHHLAQFTHGLGITGRRRCVVAALIGLDDVRIYYVDRDEELIAAIRTRCVDFWEECVRPKRAPDPIKFADVSAEFPIDNDRTVEATPEIAEAVRELRAAGAAVKREEARVDHLRMRIGDYMREYSTLTVGGRVAVTFKAQTAERIETAALRRQHPDLAALFTREDSSRVMRIASGFR